jgi:tetratricopeptide (TPR) repeat protein
MEYQAKAQQALGLVASRRHAEAIPLLRELLLRYTYVVDFEYDDWLRGLADSAKAVGQHVAAGYVYLYLHYFDLAYECFQNARSRVDLALCEEVRGRYEEAAWLYREEGRHVKAALNLERTGGWDRAVEAWEVARSHVRPADAPYAYALATVNLALAMNRVGPSPRVRELFVEAIMILEGLADEWEEEGFLDEALGAYHVLCMIGQVERRFENLAEGYCNAIRLLKTLGQTYRTFRYYAAVAALGQNLGEDQAVATLHREAADFAVRTGTLYQNFYLKQAAESYLRVARRMEELGTFPELSENATLAAVDAYNQMGDLKSVEQCYWALSKLGLEPDKSARYERLAKETATMPPRAFEVYEPSRLLRTPPELPEVWREELVEWEAGDDPMTVLSRIVWDLEFSDPARRQALNLLLVRLDLRQKGERSDPSLQRDIAQAMSGLRYDIAYKTLRQLVESPHVAVRAEVMASAGRMRHPKAFLLLDRGLKDGVEAVRKAALEALALHTYPEAFDPLVRTLQQHTKADVREAGVRALGQIKSFEAAEQLWGMLRAEASSEEERRVEVVTVEAFRANLKPEWRAIFRSKLQSEPKGARERLGAILG